MGNEHEILLSYINNLISIPMLDAEELIKPFRHKRMKKNELFLNAGEPMREIGFITNGIFRYFYLDYEGKDRTKYFVGERNFVLSLSSFIERAPSQFSIEAMKDADILVADTSTAYGLLENNTYWQTIYRNILERTYVYKEKREAEFLLYDAKTRYLKFIGEFPDICNKVKQHYIASYLGITAESLSRIRSQIGTS